MDRIDIIVRNENEPWYSSVKGTDQTWVNRIEELRNIVYDNLDNFQKTGKSIYLMKFLGREGFLIGYLTDDKQGRRGTEHTCAWMHVPADIKLQDNELSENVHSLKANMQKVLGLPENENEGATIEDKLRRKFTDFGRKDGYGTDSAYFDFVSKITSADNGKIAAVYYDGDTPGNILECIPQKWFSSFSYVFLINRSSGIGIKPAGNIEEKKFPKDFPKVVRFDSPEKEDGFTPYIEGKPFEGRRYDWERTEISITWKKDKYKDINCKYSGEDMANGNFHLPKDKKEREVSVKLFNIIDKDKTVCLNDCSIKINGRTLDQVKPLYLPEQEYLGEVTVSVSKKGYHCLEKNGSSEKEFQGKIRLEEYNETKPFKIYMERDDNNYEFTIPTLIENSDGKNCIEELEWKLSSKEIISGNVSPLQGYSYKTSLDTHGTTIKGELKYTDGKVLSELSSILKKKWLSLVLCIVSFMLGGAVVFSVQYFSLERTGKESEKVIKQTKEHSEAKGIKKLCQLIFKQKNKQLRKEDKGNAMDSTNNMQRPAKIDNPDSCK